MHIGVIFSIEQARPHTMESASSLVSFFLERRGER